MPPILARIFIQLQDSKDFSYVGAPRALECPNCKHQWFFHVEKDKVKTYIRCFTCEALHDLQDLFDQVTPSL